jgi:hypothetical protein
MTSTSRQLAMLFVGLATWAFAGPAAHGQFRSGMGMGPAGRSFLPGGGLGFNYSAYPTATMSSSGYSSAYGAGGSSGYGSGSYQMPDPYGGYLRGSADVINAQGRYSINSQQAYLTKEQVQTAQISNRRRAFDEWLYERANTPSANDERERVIRDELRRSRNDPPLPEVWSGKALNALLADAQKLQMSGVPGPDVALDEGMLKLINVTSGKDGSNFGLLKHGAKLDWPLALLNLDGSRELREDLQAAVAKAYQEARDGKRADPGTLQKIDDYASKLQSMLVKNVSAVPFAEYSQAKTYLKQLDDAAKELARDNAHEFIDGSLTPKAANVAELVEFMTRKGLHFASANAKEKHAYLALHRALVAYDTGANSLAAERER